MTSIEVNLCCGVCLNVTSGNGCRFCTWWDGISVVWYDRVEDLAEAFWLRVRNETSPEKLRQQNFNGATWDQMITAHVIAGGWAFTDRKNVYAWRGRASDETMVEILGHELGHAMKAAPALFIRLGDGTEEEAEAQRWGLVARRALQWTRERVA